jgi:hypothetical protein
MLFEKDIQNLVKDISGKKLNVEYITIKYSYSNNYAILSPTGVPDVVDDQEYLDNIEENLHYLNFSFLETFGQHLRMDFDATVQMDIDGNIDNKIQIEVKVTDIHNKAINGVCMKSLRQKLLPMLAFHKHIKNVEFKGHKSQVTSLHFHMELELKQVNPLIKTNSFNNAILSNWLFVTQYLSTLDKEQFRIYYSIPVVDGKMKESIRKQSITHRYDFNKEDAYANR